MTRAATLATLLTLAALPPTGAADPAPPTDLEGTWVEVVRMVSRAERPGLYAPRPPTTLVVAGSVATWKAGDRTVRQSLLKPVPGQDPKAADLMTVVGGEFWLSRAIYKVEGDTLTVCEAVRDAPRPTAFRSELGIDAKAPRASFAVLTTYRRRRP